MVEIIFLSCFVVVVIIVKYYIKSLENLLRIDSAGELINLTLSVSSLSSKYFLMKDFRFFFYVVSGSYKEKIISIDLINALSKTRKYMIMQYPFVFIMFLMPILVNVLGLRIT